MEYYMTATHWTKSGLYLKNARNGNSSIEIIEDSRCQYRRFVSMQQRCFNDKIFIQKVLTHKFNHEKGSSVIYFLLCFIIHCSCATTA
jgi:hypothetical protein